MDLDQAWNNIKLVCFRLPLTMEDNQNLRVSIATVEKALHETKTVPGNGQVAADLAALNLDDPV